MDRLPITMAKKVAKSHDKPIYIVRDNTRGKVYHLAFESEIDTFFLGCPVEAVVHPCGEVEY